MRGWEVLSAILAFTGGGGPKGRGSVTGASSGVGTVAGFVDNTESWLSGDQPAGIAHGLQGLGVPYSDVLVADGNSYFRQPFPL